MKLVINKAQFNQIRKARDLFLHHCCLFYSMPHMHSCNLLRIYRLVFYSTQIQLFKQVDITYSELAKKLRATLSFFNISAKLVLSEDLQLVPFIYNMKLSGKVCLYVLLVLLPA